jgi:hypothetical protein
LKSVDLPTLGKPTMPHLKPMDQNSLARGGGSLSAFVRPRGKIFGNFNVDARRDGLFGSEKPPYAVKRRKRQTCA